jgi:hypothetical protein
MTAMREANPWRAGCGESRMPGSEGGVRKRAYRKVTLPFLEGVAPCSYLTVDTTRSRVSNKIEATSTLEAYDEEMPQR